MQIPEDTTLKRIVSLLLEPHSSIIGERKRQQARLLSSLLLISIPIVAFTWFTSDLLQYVAPTYLGVILFLAIVYLGARTRYYSISLVLTISGFTFLPLIIWFFGTNWTADDLPRLMPWVFIAMITVSLLTRPKVVIIQGSLILFIVIILVGGLFAIPIQSYDSHLGTIGIIVFFVYLTSYMLDSHVEQLNTHAQELDRKHGELEVFTQFLSHDLRNDMQGLLFSLESAEMLIDISSDQAREALIQTKSLGERMAHLVNIISMPLENPATDLVRQIEDIATQSQESHDNLSITINATDDVQKQLLSTSRLLSLVWTNIFRNASQFGGPQTTVTVDISLEEEDILIMIPDNGPGIPTDRRERLFLKGNKVDEDEKGLGLYLSQVVLNGHGGSIELSENSGSLGAEFIIRIPLTRSLDILK